MKNNNGIYVLWNLISEAFIIEAERNKFPATLLHTVSSITAVPANALPLER